MLDAENMGLSIALSHIGVGTAKYDPQTATSNIALVAEIERYPLNGGSVEPVSRTLRFISNIEPTVTADCFEIGLFTSEGILFAVAAAEGNTPLIRLVAFIVCIATFGMKVEDINADHLVIQLDPHAPVSVALMNQHLAHSNPHPQYPLSKELANVIWHVGSWHGTDSTQYDPSIALKPLFGYDTSWMLLPHIPRGVETLNDAVGAITGMESGTVVKAFTTRIWKRLRDGTSAPAYSLTADKAVVDEGGKVKFSLVTSGLDAGTPVDWKITGIQSDDIVPGDLSGQFIVDAAGKASYTVDIVEDNKTEGNEILKFALAYIPNKQASVFIIDTSKYPEGSTTYYEGIHEIVILPNQTVKFHLHGAMGGGGGSIWSGSNDSADGRNGGDVSCTIDTSILTAGGGKAGTGGVWGNGSSYHNGQPGKGGTASAIDAAAIFEDVEETAGINATTYDRWGTQKGAEALSSILGQMPGGGDGAAGLGDERWSYGGAAGSGARVRAIFTNITNQRIIAKIVVGKFGEGWKSWGNAGADGGIGFAIVETYNDNIEEVAPPVPALTIKNIAPVTDPAPEDKITVHGTILTNGIAMPYQVKVKVGNAAEINAVISAEQNSDDSFNWSAVIGVGALTQNTALKAWGNAKHLIYQDLISDFSNPVQKTIAVTITPEPEPEPEAGTETGTGTE